MKEFLKNIFDNTLERVKSPFLGSFIISWIVYNWQAIVYFIRSKEDIEVILTTIGIEYNQSGSYTAWLIPLGFALFYVAILPYINLVLGKLSFFGKDLLKANAIKLKTNEYTAMIKLAEEQAKYEEAKSEYKTIKEANQKQISLIKEIEELKETLELEKEDRKKEVNEHVMAQKDLQAQLNFELSKNTNVYTGSWVSEYENQYEFEFKKTSVFEKFERLAVNISIGNNVMNGLTQHDLLTFVRNNVLDRSPGENNLEYKLTLQGEAYWLLYQLENKDLDITSFVQ